MTRLPEKLELKLEKRRMEEALRKLPESHVLVDFSSNDYLGLAREVIPENLQREEVVTNGATGSRLLTGNHPLYGELESFLSEIYDADAALVYNSGYNANVGFFSSVPQRGDIVLYDELIHASIRDGIALGHAKSYKFDHNDLESLQHTLKTVSKIKLTNSDSEIYVVTESVFSMDGDTPDLKQLVNICSKEGLHLIVDEAHAIGVFGKGLVPQMGLSADVFARIITFGKAFGCHGAAIMGSALLKEYLVNFSRSLIYTTALPPHTLSMILSHYKYLKTVRSEKQQQLQANIDIFKKTLKKLGLEGNFIPSNSAIHCMIIPENKRAKALSQKLHDGGFDVKPILYPTVKKGEERLRFCLHTYNTEDEITEALKIIKKHIKQ